jgi:hypothetical protein
MRRATSRAVALTSLVTRLASQCTTLAQPAESRATRSPTCPTMGKVIEFTIPAVPPSLNVWSRGHWSKRNAMVREWHGLVAMFMRPRCFSVADNVPPASVTLSFVSRKDADNCAKAVMDSLVHNGLLLDDGPSGVKSTTLKARRAEKGEPDSTTVRIEYPEPVTSGKPVSASKDARRRPNAGDHDTLPKGKRRAAVRAPDAAR